jgi:hypothetical protein
LTIVYLCADHVYNGTRVQSEPHGSGNLSLWQDSAALRRYTTPGPDLLSQPLIYHTALSECRTVP